MFTKKAFGTQDLAGQIPADEKTIYRISSVSKIYTALAALKLVDLGILSLDEPVKTYLGDEPWFQPMTLDPNNSQWIEEMTLRQILSHTSGLQKGSGTNAWMDIGVHATGAYPSMRKMKTNMKNVVVRFQPGSSLGYSNVAFFLTSTIVAKYSQLEAPDDQNEISELCAQSNLGAYWPLEYSV